MAARISPALWAHFVVAYRDPQAITQVARYLAFNIPPPAPLFPVLEIRCDTLYSPTPSALRARIAKLPPDGVFLFSDAVTQWALFHLPPITYLLDPKKGLLHVPSRESIADPIAAGKPMRLTISRLSETIVVP